MSKIKDQENSNIKQIFYNSLDMLFEKFEHQNKRLEEIDSRLKAGGLQKEKE